MPVEGVGGIFIRAKDPDLLANWYRNNLNVGGGCAGGDVAAPDEWTWMTAGGPVVFAPFPLGTEYFAADKAFMLNFRVTGLAALLVQLRGAGIDVVTNPEWDDAGMGQFARVHDPEGNPVELWEPPAPLP